MICKSEENLIKRLRLLEIDHAPDGFPAITMEDLTTLLDIIEREQGILRDKIFMIQKLREQLSTLKDTIREARTYF